MRGSKLTLTVAFLLSVTPALSASLGETETDYAVLGQDIRNLAANLAGSIGYPVLVDPDVSGTVVGLIGKFSPDEFLNRVTVATNSRWFFDGEAVHITPAEDDRTLLLALEGMELDDLRQKLTDLGFYDARFPFVATQDEGLVRLMGPPRYVEIVEQVVAAIPETPTAAPSTDDAPVPGAPATRLLVIQGGSVEVLPDGKR